MKKFRIFTNTNISVSDNEIDATFSPGVGGCFLIFLLYAINFTIAVIIMMSIFGINKYTEDLISSRALLFIILCFFFAFIEYYLLSNFIKKKKYKRQKEEILIKKAKEAEKQAQQLSKTANELYSLALTDVSNLQRLLNKTSECLDHADKSFVDNLYSPFWRDIEEAGKGLSFFQKTIQELDNDRTEYYQTLEGRNHNFSDYPVKVEQIPNPKPILDRFYDTMKKGLSNFEFAQIWESHKTRKAIIEGFRNLEDSIEHLGNIVTMSFSHLELSIKHDMACFVKKDTGLMDSIDDDNLADIMQKKYEERRKRDWL